MIINVKERRMNIFLGCSFSRAFICESRYSLPAMLLERPFVMGVQTWISRTLRILEAKIATAHQPIHYSMLRILHTKNAQTLQKRIRTMKYYGENNSCEVKRIETMSNVVCSLYSRIVKELACCGCGCYNLLMQFLKLSCLWPCYIAHCWLLALAW